MEMIVRPAQEEDMEKISRFLRKAGLGSGNAGQTSDSFLVLEDKLGQIQGTLGMEEIGAYGLLRSFVISRQVPEQTAMSLFEKIMDRAREKGLKRVYLAVNNPSSVKLFSLFGFIVQEKAVLPAELLESLHGQQVYAVNNSIFMMSEL